MKRFYWSGSAMNLEKKLFLGVITLLFVLIIFKPNSVLSWGPGNNYRNYSVRTTVNVTNAYPEILNITCNNLASVTLNAGTTKTVNCTVQIRDYNGGGDINYVNATFYYYLNQSTNPDDNNTHYTNTSCINLTSNGYYTNWSCSFDVWYYAINGTWVANATVNDTWGAKDTRGFNYTTISGLLALNASSTINYGSLAVTDTSGSIQANVTNLGNLPINVSVYAFGDDNATLGAGYAMLCDIRNISMPNERYDLAQATLYDSMTPVTGAAVTIPGLTVQKQTLPSVYIINSTYWRLHVNISDNPFGVCNGTVVFSALSP
jgi:hypothetical protein